MPTEYEKHEKGDLELIMLKNVFVSPGDDEYKCSLNLRPLPPVFRQTLLWKLFS